VPQPRASLVLPDRPLPEKPIVEKPIVEKPIVAKPIVAKAPEPEVLRPPPSQGLLPLPPLTPAPASKPHILPSLTSPSTSLPPVAKPITLPPLSLPPLSLPPSTLPPELLHLEPTQPGSSGRGYWMIAAALLVLVLGLLLILL
jgi:hypothetical protein